MKKEKIHVQVSGIDDLKKTLNDIFSDIIGEQPKEHKVAIGKVSEELRLEYANWKHQKEDLEDEIKFKQQQLEKRMLRELSDLYETRFNYTNKIKKELWEKIEKELGLTNQKLNLNIDHKTGIISHVVFIEGESPKSKSSNVLN